MSNRFVWIMIVGTIMGVAAMPLLARTWKSRDGRYSVKAEFVDFKDGKVRIKKEDGNTVAVAMTALSIEDQQWVRDELRRRREAADNSSTPTPVDPRAQTATTAEWFQWRGPNRDGKSPDTGLLTSWEESPPPLVWSVRGTGRGRSSVAVAGGKIFTMGIKDGATQLIALAESDGSLVWETPAGGGSDVNCTPTVDGDRVYALSFDGDLLCADAATGSEVWRKNFGRDFGGRMMSGWGYAESPLIDGDRLICTPGGNQAMMVALDKRTGEPIWRTEVPDLGPRGKDGAGYSSAVVSNGAGVRQYVQLVGRGLIGVSADDGRLLWVYNRIANDTANIPTPIVTGDYVFASTGYQTGAALLRLRRGGRGVTADEVYFLDHTKLQNHHGGMIQIGEYLYCGHGHNEGFPLCIHLPTGRDVWRPGRGPGSNSAAVSYADGHLYFRYQDATMALIEATPDAYRLKGTFKIASRNAESWPHPVISGGKLFLRDQDELHCYDLRKKP